MNLRTSINTARLGGPGQGADGTAVFEFRFGGSDPTFAGHFPGGPILPGVFQLEMTRAAAEWTLDGALIVCEISKAKFQRPILPEETVRLALKLSEAGERVRARALFTVAGQPAGETVLSLCRNQS